MGHCPWTLPSITTVKLVCLFSSSYTSHGGGGTRGGERQRFPPCYTWRLSSREWRTWAQGQAGARATHGYGPASPRTRAGEGPAMRGRRHAALAGAGGVRAQPSSQRRAMLPGPPAQMASERGSRSTRCRRREEHEDGGPTGRNHRTPPTLTIVSTRVGGSAEIVFGTSSFLLYSC